jgi:cytidylate kinase
MRRKGAVIALDGPSGSGKSTAGRALARRMGFVYVDSGAMYRALALGAVRAKVDFDDEARLAELAQRVRIELTSDGGVFLQGEDVGAEIRTPLVSAAASRVSAHPAVRREMVLQQRELGRDGGVVMDGRDIGTAVFPNAEFKFYIDAALRRRAERRQAELAARGNVMSVDQVEHDVRERDQHDSEREASPLVRADGAILVDTTNLTPDEVVEHLLGVIREAGARAQGGSPS